MSILSFPTPKTTFKDIDNSGLQIYLEKPTSYCQHILESYQRDIKWKNQG